MSDKPREEKPAMPDKLIREAFEAAKDWLGVVTADGDYDRDYYGFTAGVEWLFQHALTALHAECDALKKDLYDAGNAIKLTRKLHAAEQDWREEAEAKLAAAESDYKALEKQAWSFRDERDTLRTQAQELSRERSELVGALEFYAKSECESCAFEHGYPLDKGSVGYDSGERARQALAKYKGQNEQS